MLETLQIKPCNSYIRRQELTERLFLDIVQNSNHKLHHLVSTAVLQYGTNLVGALSAWSRIIVLQDRSLYHIPLPPIQCCVRIFRATTSSCKNQHWRRGETGMDVPTNVTSIADVWDACERFQRHCVKQRDTSKAFIRCNATASFGL